MVAGTTVTPRGWTREARTSRPAGARDRGWRMTKPGSISARVDAARGGAPTPDGFAEVVCGIDGRRLGFEAARQAARLASPSGRLTLVAVVEPFAALSGRWGDEPSRWRIELKRERSPGTCVAEL